MEEHYLENNCSFRGVKPIMADLPYPPNRVRERNRTYAELLRVDYCGMVSEMTAIVQYINNEGRLSRERCALAGTLLGIARAEMMHLQKLGELILLLGGNINFAFRGCNGREMFWTPEYLDIPDKVENMLIADIEAEKAAIKQYEMHINMIGDDCVNAVLERIIRDEEYHIMLLRALKDEC